ncbi:MAG: SIS domain-containing protein [Eubacteriales bacterium]|nr:SIS domain-containing protein [Eubacteriales bacterium]
MGNYLEDILSQPEQLAYLFEKYAEEGSLMGKMKELSEKKWKSVIFTGMGSSHFCAISAGIYLKKRGIDNQVISTGELLYYEQEILKEDTLLILISQSGESAETVKLLEKISADIFVVGITNEPESTLAKKSALLCPLFVDREESVTTRTYLASICVCLWLAEAILGGDCHVMTKRIWEGMECLRNVIHQKEKYEMDIKAFAENCGTVSVMSRGYSMGSVAAGTLFLREVAKIPAMEFDEAEFKHGPLEMVENGFKAIVFAPEGEGKQLNVCMAEGIVEKGGEVLLITDRNCRVLENDRLKVIRLDCSEEVTAPLFQIVPVQFLADLIAKNRGICPGKFRWSSKITSSEYK